MKKNKTDNCIEVEYEEIHTDENGNEYTKKGVSSHIIFKILPIVYFAFIIISLLILLINIFAGIAAVICAMVISSKKVRNIINNKIADKLMETNKYYDNREVLLNGNIGDNQYASYIFESIYNHSLY